MKPSFAARLGWIAFAMLGCTPAEPRFGALRVTDQARQATLSGVTNAEAGPAIDLSAGCPGFVDPSLPEHRVRVESGLPIEIAARSPNGPLALAIVSAEAVQCDADGGSGHRPHVRIEQPGEYAVHVGALEAAAALSYELSLRPASTLDSPPSDESAEEEAPTAVSVTVTSDPSGATVRDASGHVLGVTPAMFVLQVPQAELGQERTFSVSLEGFEAAPVQGRLLAGALSLHAQLARPGVPAVAVPPPSDAPGATLLEASSHDPPQPIRDYTTVSQALQVERDCAISGGRIDVDLTHSFVSDLRVTLRSPAGRSIVLHNHTGGSGRRLRSPFSIAPGGRLSALLGTSGRGRWQVVVEDSVGADSGTLRSFQVHLECGGAVASPASSPTRRRRPPPGPTILLPPFATQPPGRTVAPWTPPRVNRVN